MALGVWPTEPSAAERACARVASCSGRAAMGVALEAPSVVDPQSYCFILCEHTDRNGWSRGAQERSGPFLTEEGAGEERVRAPEERVGLRERRSGATARGSEARSRRAVARVQERCMACNGKRLSTRCVHARQYVRVRSESADVATLC